METRATLRPGQKGTQKLVERYGERLVCVRYLYDAKASRQYKTVELIVSSAPWQPKPRSLRRRDDDIVSVRIAYGEVDLRERARRLGAVWRPAQYGVRRRNSGRSPGEMRSGWGSQRA